LDDEVGLRQLQNLRSSSSAHRKGKNYKKSIKVFEIDTKTLSDVFSDILNKSIEILEFYINIVYKVNEIA